MNDVQAKVISLISVIDALAHRFRLRYCATDRLAWSAMSLNAFEGTSFDASLLMSRRDLSKLKKALEENMPPDCEIVTHEDDKLLPSGSLSLVATNTTAIKLSGKFRTHPGISVAIKPLTKTAEGAFTYVNDARKEVSLSSNPLASISDVAFENMRLPIPSPSTRYYQEAYGAKWESTCGLPVYRTGMGMIADTAIPYREFLANVSEQEIQELGVELREFNAWRKENITAKSKAVDDSLTPVKVDAQRFRLGTKYLPFKQALLDEWQQGHREDVGRALADYLSWIKKLYPLHATVYFDKELFELAVETLRYQGWPNANKIDGLVPKRHKQEPLQDILARYV